MKGSKLTIALDLLVLSLLFGSCSVVEGVFKAGMGFGIFIVVVIIVVVLLVMLANKK